MVNGLPSFEQAVWHRSLASRLRDLARRMDVRELFPTVIPEARDIVATDPYAFCLAACLDRRTKAEIIWTIPYDLQQALGHLDPFLIDQMSQPELAEAFSRLPRKPRYINAAPRTIKELTHKVVHEFGGDASRIWSGRSAEEVHKTFLSIYGVGPGIASMTVLLIEKGFGHSFAEPGRPAMDIKPDVHTMRVLYRLGVADSQTPGAAVAAARRINPEFPGEIDGILWRIGQAWCHPVTPDCAACPLDDLCHKVGL